MHKYMKARIPPRSFVLCTKCSTSNVDFETYMCSMPKRVSILSCGGQNANVVLVTFPRKNIV